SVCHRLDNLGTEIGPNLATLQNRGAETILLNVLDPNREVNPQYVNYVLVTTEGKSITGLISAETATSVTLKRQENATDTVLRVNIDELRSTGLSIMPEGLEKQLDQQALADLIAYLLSVKSLRGVSRFALPRRAPRSTTGTVVLRRATVLACPGSAS